MGYVVFDTELASPVTGEEGSTWDDARSGRLGLSVVCCYVSTSNLYRFFDHHNIDDCVDLLESVDTVVSYNGKDFDLPVISGVANREIRPKTHFDILIAIWQALPSRQKGYKLGQVCERTIGQQKLRCDAPAHVAEGRYAELFSYCLHDVWLTENLLQHIMRHGYVVMPDGDRLYLAP